MTPQEKTELYEMLLQRANRPGTFTAVNGRRVTSVGDGCAQGEADLTDAHLNPLGIVHGGVYSTMMDQVAGAAACSRGSMCRTVDCEVRFFAPAAGTKIYSHAQAIRMGRSITVMRAWVTDEAGTICAEGTYTFRMKEGFPQD